MPVCVLAGLLVRPRILTVYALGMLLLRLPALALLAVDERTIRAVGVWSRPLKFMGATALFALPTAWFMGRLPAGVGSSPVSRVLVRTVTVTSLFEVACISTQASGCRFWAGTRVAAICARRTSWAFMHNS